MNYALITRKIVSNVLFISKACCDLDICKSLSTSFRNKPWNYWVWGEHNAAVYKELRIIFRNIFVMKFAVVTEMWNRCSIVDKGNLISSGVQNFYFLLGMVQLFHPLTQPQRWNSRTSLAADGLNRRNIKICCTENFSCWTCF